MKFGSGQAILRLYYYFILRVKNNGLENLAAMVYTFDNHLIDYVILSCNNLPYLTCIMMPLILPNIKIQDKKR